jgi:hypothetical protein
LCDCATVQQHNCTTVCVLSPAPATATFNSATRSREGECKGGEIAALVRAVRTVPHQRIRRQACGRMTESNPDAFGSDSFKRSGGSGFYIGNSRVANWTRRPAYQTFPAYALLRERWAVCSAAWCRMNRSGHRASTRAVNRHPPLHSRRRLRGARGTAAARWFGGPEWERGRRRGRGG